MSTVVVEEEAYVDENVGGLWWVFRKKQWI